VVEHDGDVLVVLPIGQLVDADVLQACEAIARAQASDDAGDVAAHCLQAIRIVVATVVRPRPGEVGDVVLEVARESRARVRPGNQLGAHAARTAINASKA